MRRVLFVLLAGLGTLVASPANARCPLPSGWDHVVGHAPHYVIFGELHGSTQSAAMFGETVCALAERHKRLLVAVELGDNDGLQRAWSSPHAVFASKLSSLLPEWTTRNDGVTSQAMFAMLVRLHALRSEGQQIDVVAFNGRPDDTQRASFKDLPGQGPHEATQADNIRRADTKSHHDCVLILVGSFHARKKSLTRGGTTYDPMAMRLAPSKQVVSLFMTYSKGKSWNCQLKGPHQPGAPITAELLDCGPHAGPGNVDWTGKPRLVATDVSDQAANPDGAYDAAYFVGPITASPPLEHDR